MSQLPTSAPDERPASAKRYRRLVSHAAVLCGVTVLVLQSAFSPARSARVAAAPQAARADVAPVASAPRPEPTPALPEWVQAALGSATPSPAPATMTQGGAADDTAQAASAVLLPALAVPWPNAALPKWVRAQRDTTLWVGPEDEATAKGAVAADGYLRPLGPLVGGRLLVYQQSDRDTAPSGQAWVDTTSVAPSGAPPWLGGVDAAGASGTLPAAPTRVSDAAAPPVSALHVAIVDDASGKLLYGEDPYDHVPEASVTKIATTIVAIERAPELAQRVSVTVSASDMASRDGSSVMGLEPGRKVALTTLLYGMMLPSGNDAAEQVAVTLAGSRERYVEWMNQEMDALGLKDTHFVNPSGMDAPGHYSSAYDMALLGRYAMRNGSFRQLAGASTYSADGFGPMYNLNRLLGLYKGADGVKIGYTDDAHKTIVASATRGGHRVFVSLMHSEDLVTDGSRLLDWVWDSFNWS